MGASTVFSFSYKLHVLLAALEACPVSTHTTWSSGLKLHGTERFWSPILPRDFCVVITEHDVALYLRGAKRGLFLSFCLCACVLCLERAVQ